MGLVRKKIRPRAGAAVPPELKGVDEWLSERRPSSYWACTRRPFPSLLLVAPLVLAYEGGVLWLEKSAPGAVRTGADTWMRQALASCGLADHWLLPLLLFLILLTWQVISYYNWRFSPAILAGMIGESAVWAVVLLGISRLIDFGFSYMEQPRHAASGHSTRRNAPFLDLFHRLPGRGDL